jgi:hypothetical protein
MGEDCVSRTWRGVRTWSGSGCRPTSAALVEELDANSSGISSDAGGMSKLRHLNVSGCQNLVGVAAVSNRARRELDASFSSMSSVPDGQVI